MESTLILPAVAPEIRRALVAAAIDCYERARPLRAYLDALPADPPAVPDDLHDRCAYAGVAMTSDAATAPVRAILAGDDAAGHSLGSFDEVERTIRPPRGVVLGPRLYLAIPHPDYADRPVGYRGDVHPMHPVVVDLANIEALTPGGGER